MALFAVMQLATPQLTVQLYTGPLLALAIAICLLLLFGVYRSERASAACCSLSCRCRHYRPPSTATPSTSPPCSSAAHRCACSAAAHLWPQRSVLAPWWILFGLGIAEPSDLHLPDFAPPFRSRRHRRADLALRNRRPVGLSAGAMPSSQRFQSHRLQCPQPRCQRRHNCGGSVHNPGRRGRLQQHRRLYSSPQPVRRHTDGHYFATHRADRSWIAIAAICLAYTTLFLCQILI